MKFYPLERIANLYDGYQHVFTVGRLSLLLIQDNGRPFIIKNECPHLGQRLQKATVNTGILRCPGHGFEFDLSTGLPVSRQSSQGNNAVRCPALSRYEVSYDGPTIGVYG